MPASEETGSGPVIHDHRRIDPVTGQVRGKHVASKPAGTRGAGRPAPAADAAETAETAETAESTGSARSAGSQEDQDAQETQKYPEEVPEVVTPEAVPGGKQEAPAADGKQAKDVEAQLAERTADLPRLPAGYAQHSKRNGPTSCTDCRPSTPTTASESTGTGRPCVSRRWPARWPDCCPCSTPSTRPGSTASCPAGSSRSPNTCRRPRAGSAW